MSALLCRVFLGSYDGALMSGFLALLCRRSYDGISCVLMSALLCRDFLRPIVGNLFRSYIGALMSALFCCALFCRVTHFCNKCNNAIKRIFRLKIAAAISYPTDALVSVGC